MFEKVLIAEDYESTSISIRKTLEDLGVIGPRYTYHCDDALLHVKNALVEEKPYELLITDLSFEPDDRPQKLLTGEALIKAARLMQPGLKVLVFSLEKRAAVIDQLFKGAGIQGYVPKGRHDAQELKAAILSLYKNKQYFSADIRQAVRQGNTHEFTKFDTTIIKLLAQGMLQKDIPDYLRDHHIVPCSLSSVEKRLYLIRDAYDFSNNEQLVIYCKELGII
jgi:DNA-binding NarL/FixJ family response regulator